MTSRPVCMTSQDTLLAFSRGELERQSTTGRTIGREYTISRIFSQYDLNNDGKLQPSELREVRLKWQGRAGQGRAKQNRTEQGRAGQGRTVLAARVS